MLLGEMIARSQEPEAAVEMLLSLDDLALVARVRDAAAAEEVTAGAFVAGAVERFAAQADDAAWLTLLGQMARSQSPGQVLLRQALKHALPQSLASVSP